jgi:hypothetical protein
VLDAVEGINSARVDDASSSCAEHCAPHDEIPLVREVEERSQAAIKTA